MTDTVQDLIVHAPDPLDFLQVPPLNLQLEPLDPPESLDSVYGSINSKLSDLFKNSPIVLVHHPLPYEPPNLQPRLLILSNQARQSQYETFRALEALMGGVCSVLSADYHFKFSCVYSKPRGFCPLSLALIPHISGAEPERFFSIKVLTT